MFAFILIFLIKFNLISCYQYLFHSNRPFPIELENRDIIYSNQSEYLKQQNYTLTKIIPCSLPNIGDGQCDEINNKEICDWDGGDCCAFTCEANCKKKQVLGNPCIYTCGSLSYNCLSTNQCSKCINGACKDINQCYSNEKFILNSIDNCIFEPLSMGNSRTIDPFCGKDPNKTIIHFTYDPTFHFAGCGLDQSFCTKNPCCDVVAANKILSNAYIGCLDNYKNCFSKNQVSRGQCCECIEGWTGVYCDIPVCKNVCVKGKCIGKNLCECEKNYSGATCDQPVCTNCVYGVCLSPGQCECFYGYSGNNCDIAVKSPFCVNGVARISDKCECFQGWVGELCEIRNCPNCINGICRDDGSCSCIPLFKFRNELDRYDNKTLLCAEISSCKIFDSFCEACNNTDCITCQDSFTLINKKCESCSELYNPQCNHCDSKTCLACDYPFELIENNCISYGMVEFSNNFYDVMEYEQKLDITINRYYNTFKDVGIFYRLVKINSNTNFLKYDIANLNNNLFNKVRNSSGFILFKNGEKSKTITLYVYPDFFVEEKETKFIIEIFNPFGGCYIGKISRAVIEIFDEIKYADLNFMQYSINGNVQIDTLKFLITLNKMNLNNSYLEIFAYSNYYDKMPKNDGNDIIIYFINYEENIRNSQYEKKIIYQIKSFSYLESLENVYQAKINFKNVNEDLNLDSNFIKSFKKAIQLNVLYCKQGIVYNYYNTVGFRKNPLVSRIMSIIEIDEFYAKTNHFSVEWVFLFKFDSIKMIKLLFFKPFNDILEIFVNSKKLNIIENSITITDKCLNYSENNDCSRITFEDLKIDDNMDFYMFKVKLIHLKGFSYIFHELITDLGIKLQFESKNSLACEIIQNPYKIEFS